MKSSPAILALLLGACLSTAFPQKVPSSQVTEVLDLQSALFNALDTPPPNNVSFSAAAQRIDVTGAHIWVAPGPGDDRGPCPGLNALANHGYLPRNGRASIFDFITATTTVFGMGVDLATVLTVYGAVFDGQLLDWSIGGTGALNGIGGAHGHYESDNSPMKADLNQYGSNMDLVLSQFKTLYDLQPDSATANYDINVLAQFRAIRFNESIAMNPWFYYGPFAGTVVTQAAFAFIYRFMANHSAEAPDGILNKDTLKSFFAISGEGDNMSWTRGYERIPDNWYRRSLLDPYGFGGLGPDSNTFTAVTPAIMQPSCNQGTVNSYTKLDGSFTGYNFTSPTDGVCFALGSVLGVTNLIPGLGLLVELLVFPLHGRLGCVAVAATNQSVIDACPGYSFYGGPTGPVAPGAIQN